MTNTVPTDTWNKDELRAAVEAYFDMLRKDRQGEKFVKKKYYQDLAARFGRSEKAFEYRMQNISYVLTLLGREWLHGLRPAKNVGSNIAGEIESLIGEIEGKTLLPVAAFETEVREAIKKNRLAKPSGNLKPSMQASTVTQYKRDATVKAWVLQAANGVCESCAAAAPFKGSDGQPYLEVHHVRQLADGGSDTVTNAVALCPNCHREVHYGERSESLIAALYERVKRLVLE